MNRFRNIHSLVKALTLLCGWLLAQPAAAQEITVLTEEMPPYNYRDEDGRVTGFSTEVVRALFDRAGLAMAGGDIRVYPWARTYRIVQMQPDTLAYSMTRSEAREDLFKWVGPIASRTIWLWKLRSRDDIQVESLADVRQYKVGAVMEFASTKYMQELGFDLDLTTTEDLNFRKLIAGRFDILAALDLAAAYQMKKLGRSYNDLERLIQLDDRYDYYLALNPETPDEVVRRLQQALERLKADGSYDQIKSRYLK